MTKLEEKLIELGYKYDEMEQHYYKEVLFARICLFDIKYDTKNYVKPMKLITKQKDIMFFELAFNEMQKDLEELKKYEN